jgi:hypothetical protein
MTVTFLHCTCLKVVLLGACSVLAFDLSSKGLQNISLWQISKICTKCNSVATRIPVNLMASPTFAFELVPVGLVDIAFPLFTMKSGAMSLHATTPVIV